MLATIYTNTSNNGGGGGDDGDAGGWKTAQKRGLGMY